MVKAKYTQLCLVLMIFASCYISTLNAQSITQIGLNILFEDTKYNFSEDDKQLIGSIIVQSEKKIRILLPSLPKEITVTISITDSNHDKIGGVNGQTDSNSPAEVTIEISNVFPGGIRAASKKALAALVYHEFHHLSRGWAIKDNKFGPGMSIAMINEGLAVVFSEIHTGVKLDAYKYPEEVNSWVEQIMKLPLNAKWSEWMYKHPDGRAQVGYRAGSFLIRQVIKKSGKNILELSELSPAEILKLVGY